MPFDDGGCDGDDDAGCDDNDNVCAAGYNGVFDHRDDIDNNDNDDNDNVCAAGYNGVFDHWDGDVSRKPPITLNAIARTHNPFSDDTEVRAGDDDAENQWKMYDEIG